MIKEFIKQPIKPLDFFKCYKFYVDELREHPNYFRDYGATIFCGKQGSGKTLSAVQTVLRLREYYPLCILVSNVELKTYPFNSYLIGDKIYCNEIDDFVTIDILKERYESGNPLYITLEYTGLEMLKNCNNSEYGVIYLIDEIHLELNSLESKNIDIEIIVEISQQRKQRKLIVGTSQIFMRMAKPIREQIFNVVLCDSYFRFIQFNKLIDATTAHEKSGKLCADVVSKSLFFHSPFMYQEYDTYCKMKRYNKEWNGRKRLENFYERGDLVDNCL